jgi:hypothetical protein
MVKVLILAYFVTLDNFFYQFPSNGKRHDTKQPLLCYQVAINQNERQKIIIITKATSATICDCFVLLFLAQHIHVRFTGRFRS